MDESTTDAATQDTGAEVTAQPEEQLAEAAKTDSESTNTEETQATEETVDQTTTSEDDFDYDSWLEKKGIDPSTPEGKAQIAKSWREMEKKMHQSTAQASELEKQVNAQPLDVDTDNELVRQALEKSNKLETTMAIREWKQTNNITPEQDEALGQYVVSNPDKAYLLKNGYLSYDDILSMSGVKNQDFSEAKKQGSREALQDVANKQRTTAINGSASQQAPAAKEDPLLAILRSDD